MMEQHSWFATWFATLAFIWVLIPWIKVWNLGTGIGPGFLYRDWQFWKYWPFSLRLNNISMFLVVLGNMSNLNMN